MRTKWLLLAEQKGAPSSWLLLAPFPLFQSFLRMLFTDLQMFRGAMNFPRKKS